MFKEIGSKCITYTGNNDMSICIILMSILGLFTIVIPSIIPTQPLSKNKTRTEAPSFSSTDQAIRGSLVNRNYSNPNSSESEKVPITPLPNRVTVNFGATPTIEEEKIHENIIQKKPNVQRGPPPPEHPLQQTSTMYSDNDEFRRRSTENFNSKMQDTIFSQPSGDHKPGDSITFDDLTKPQQSKSEFDAPRLPSTTYIKNPQRQMPIPSKSSSGQRSATHTQSTTPSTTQQSTTSTTQSSSQQSSSTNSSKYSHFNSTNTNEVLDEPALKELEEEQSDVP